MAGDGYRPLLRAGLAGLALYAFFFALWFVYPAGMGFGDVKLGGVLGMYLGWFGWSEVVVGAFLSFLLGGVVGLLMIATRRGTRKSEIPFGPYMLIGAFLEMMAAEAGAAATGGASRRARPPGCWAASAV